MKHSSVTLSLLAVLGASLWILPAAHAADCVVINTSDSALGLPPVPGSLRDCLERVGHGDTITFDATVFDLVNSDAATTIFIDSALPLLDDGLVTIEAQDRRVTVNGSGASSAAGFEITSSGNKVLGLTIIGFTNSGIVVSGSSNVLGGDRSLGTGPNGQGLRIANCGAFGIELTGSGTTDNHVKGCWIGLDASGSLAEPNLAGVAISGGASGNTLGGVVPGESNFISGNTSAGVTISGPGTDNNVVIGNTVGAAAVVIASRRELPNGSSGVFISNGAQGTLVGGENSGEGNVVAFNGGSGIEVRTATTKHITVRGNDIAGNRGGGIKLFDGSNEGVRAPKVTKVVSAPPSGAGPTFTVTGTTASAGTVELFNDTSSQGSTYLTRSTVGGNAFSFEIDGVLVAGLTNLTATFTDASGNTSPFSVLGVTDEDTDGDVVGDEIEIAMGTSVSDPLSVPDLAGALDPKKIGITLNFGKPGKDSINAQVRLALPTGFTFDGVTVVVKIGGHLDHLVLDAKGKAKSADKLVAIAMKTDKTGVTTLKYGVKKAMLQPEMAPVGLANETTLPDNEVVLAIAVGLIGPSGSGTGKTIYHAASPLTYKATQGKSGKAK